MTLYSHTAEIEQQSVSKSKLMKRLSNHKYELFALLVIALAVGLRLLLTVLGWPTTNADEDTMGIMARHIAYNGEHPVVFYGQNYMGTIEAYLGAAFFLIFGPSLLTLRLSVMVLYALFLASMYLLTSLLYTKKLAVFVLVLLGLGSTFMFSLELYAKGGSTQTLLFGTLAFLLASWLAQTSSQDVPHSSRHLSVPPTTLPFPLIHLCNDAIASSFAQQRCKECATLSTNERNRLASLRRDERRRWLRFAAYGGWGLVVGLGVWSDLIVLPFFIMSSLLLLLFCRRDLRSWAPVFLLLGLAIGVFPLIVYNIQAPPGQDSLSTLLWNFNRPHALPNLVRGIQETIQMSLPTATGDPFCPVSAVDYPIDASPRSIQCKILHAGWSAGYMILLTLAIILAGRVLWRLRARMKVGSPEEKQEIILHFTQLCLLASAAITITGYAVSSAPLGLPHSHARYLIGLLIVTPALIWPLWKGASSVKSLFGYETSLRRFTRLRVKGIINILINAIINKGALLLISLLFLIGAISIAGDVPSSQAANQQQDEFIVNLIRIGATHIYSDYWTCDRIAFMSQEKIICSVTDRTLIPNFNRYSPYHSIVKADPHSAYVFRYDIFQNVATMHKADLLGHGFRRFVFDGYIVYQPR